MMLLFYLRCPLANIAYLDEDTIKFNMYLIDKQKEEIFSRQANVNEKILVPKAHAPQDSSEESNYNLIDPNFPLIIFN